MHPATTGCDTLSQRAQVRVRYRGPPMHPHRIAWWFAPLLVACEPPDPELLEETVEIAFAARVAGQPFACGTTYPGLGADSAPGTPHDLRFYVHDVRLVDADGTEHPVTLQDDGQHQGGGVALLDFEDGSGACVDGTAATHTTLRGTIGARLRHSSHGSPGLRFRIGVPAEHNHADRSSLPPPLDASAMSWMVDDGHVFFATQGRFGVDATLVHGVQVGSTGCIGEGSSVICTQSNRPEISLPAFEPGEHTVIVDWGALFADIALANPSPECDASTGDTRCTCDSLGPEALCRPLFATLGLEWTSGASTGAQTVFLRAVTTTARAER